MKSLNIVLPSAILSKSGSIWITNRDQPNKTQPEHVNVHADTLNAELNRFTPLNKINPTEEADS